MRVSHDRKVGGGRYAGERMSDPSRTDMDRCGREIVELEALCMELGCLPRRWSMRGGTKMSVALVRIRNRFVDRSRCFVLME